MRRARGRHRCRVQELLTGTVNLVTSVMVGGGLPTPDLEGLPPLPQPTGPSQVEQQGSS